MLLRFIHMAFLTGRRGYSDTSLLVSKDSSASDTFQTEVPLCRKITWVLHLYKGCKATKTKEWTDMTWEMKGGFPNSDHN